MPIAIPPSASRTRCPIACRNDYGVVGGRDDRRVGDEDRTVGRRAQDQRTCGKVYVAAAVDAPELAAAGHVEPEVGVALRDAGDLLAKPVDPEDLAEEIQVVAGGVMGSCPESVISVRGAAATARSSDRWPR